MVEYFFGITDKGVRRDKNEDTFIAQETGDNKYVVACVIDGVGGYSAGEVAAEITRSVLVDHLQDPGEDIISSMKIAVLAANARIIAKIKSDHSEQMACVLTCAVADIRNNKLYYVHIGDTRLYLFRDHSLVKISKDHSVVGFLEESGRLTEEDAMRHPRRNEITRALGFEEDLEYRDLIESGESPFLPGDIILVCSDGLSDMISSNAITSILTSKDSVVEKGNALITAANEAGGNDNITAVVVKNYKTQVPKVAWKPVEKIGIVNNRKDENKTSGEKPAKIKRKKRGYLYVLGITILCCLAVLFFQKNVGLKAAKKHVPLKTMSILQPSYTDLLYRAKNDKKYQPSEPLMIIPGPVHIDRDSFYFSGDGITLIADSAYKGPALIIGKDAKQVILDSITFKDFDIAVVMNKNNVRFRDVRFVNCRIPVQYRIDIKDSVVSGQISDSIFRIKQ